MIDPSKFRTIRLGVAFPVTICESCDRQYYIHWLAYEDELDQELENGRPTALYCPYCGKTQKEYIP